jgi:hypothetical protein
VTVDEVRARVEEIRRHGIDENDDERAHGDEDDLRADLLRFIASDAPEPFAELARVALEADAMKFGRWCA